MCLLLRRDALFNPGKVDDQTYNTIPSGATKPPGLTTPTYPHSVFQILPAHAPPLLDHARELIAEYGRSIVDVAGASLRHQRFEEELANLPGQFAPPRGRLLIAVPDGPRSTPAHPAGCIALRPLPTLGRAVCEMKRMYVRPEARGRGLGRALAAQLIQDARNAGYTLMKLDSDTDPRFDAACALYRRLGFANCPNYNADPDPRTIWMELRL